MTSCREINIASERILSYSYFKFTFLAGEKMEFCLCCFLFLRQERVHVNLFLQKIVYNKIGRSLDYLNQFKVLYAYVDITVLV